MESAKRIRRILLDYLQTAALFQHSKLRKLYLFPHYLLCKIKYHCNAEEYFFYKFYNVRHNERKNFLLVYHQRNLYPRINQKGFTRSKLSFAERFPLQFGRDFLNMSSCRYDTFLAFFKKQVQIVIKPDCGSYGRGIHFLRYENDSQACDIFREYADKAYICEQHIKQHPDLDALNPGSVNTLRIMSLLANDTVTIIAAALRSANCDTAVDNLKHGGIGANINIETGVIDTPGKDYSGNVYQTHPATGCAFLGFNIPFWNETVSLIQQLHPQLSQCPILGWDVAITDQKPVIVEINNAPGPMIHQFIDNVPRGETVLQFIKEELCHGTAKHKGDV